MGFQETFRALGDPVRREILTLLRGGKMSAGEIGAHFDMTGATISYHLSQLKKAGLIVEQRDKNFIYYQLNASVFEEILLWLSYFREVKDHINTAVPCACGARTYYVERSSGYAADALRFKWRA